LTHALKITVSSCRSALLAYSVWGLLAGLGCSDEPFRATDSRAANVVVTVPSVSRAAGGASSTASALSSTGLGMAVPLGAASSTVKPSVLNSDTTQMSDTTPKVPGFQIDLRFVVEVSPRVKAAFEAAQRLWQTAITGDIPDVTFRKDGSCAGNVVSGAVDDLVIFVDVRDIDGKGKILGGARPCAVRTKSLLPVSGVMQFDVADLEDFAQMGRLEEVVIHEMAHVLGFGSLWQDLDLLANPTEGTSPEDTAFLGKHAIDALNAVGGTSYQGAKVPVENTGGDGTVNAHWRDAVLGNELMTSYLSDKPGVLSRISLGALEDVGYQVDYAQAEDYRWLPQKQRAFTEPLLNPALTEASLLGAAAEGAILPLTEMAIPGRIEVLEE
jgi:Leishmanolysin